MDASETGRGNGWKLSRCEASRPRREGRPPLLLSTLVGDVNGTKSASCCGGRFFGRCCCRPLPPPMSAGRWPTAHISQVARFTWFSNVHTPHGHVGAGSRPARPLPPLLPLPLPFPPPLPLSLEATILSLSRERRPLFLMCSAAGSTGGVGGMCGSVAATGRNGSWCIAAAGRRRRSLCARTTWYDRSTVVSLI